MRLADSPGDWRLNSPPITFFYPEPSSLRGQRAHVLALFFANQNLASVQA